LQSCQVSQPRRWGTDPKFGWLPVREMALQESQVLLVGRQQPPVQPARRVPAEDLGSDEDKACPVGSSLGQRRLRIGVPFEHDVDDARDLVAQNVELHAGGDVGDHLGFEENGEASVGGSQQRINFRRPLQLLPRCMRSSAASRR
jgi:hypothetical protein